MTTDSHTPRGRLGAPRPARLPEFPDLRPSEARVEPPAGRRAVLQGGAASLALAATGCEEGPESWGFPLYARPQGVAAEAARYATVLELEGIGRGVLVHTRAGHPVKIEGNPEHPEGYGKQDKPAGDDDKSEDQLWKQSEDKDGGNEAADKDAEDNKY